MVTNGQTGGGDLDLPSLYFEGIQEPIDGDLEDEALERVDLPDVLQHLIIHGRYGCLYPLDSLMGVLPQSGVDLSWTSRPDF